MSAREYRTVGLCVVASLALAPLAVQAAPRIERVVVFTDRAEVTRGGDVACGPDAQLEFASLPPSLDPASLRAEAGEATVGSVELQSRPRSEAFSPQVQALDVKLRALARELSEQQDAVARAHAQARLSRALAAEGGTQISREMPLAAPDVKAWSVAYEQTLAAELRADVEVQKAEAKLRALQRSEAELDEQRGKLVEGGQKTETFARVRLACASGTAHVRLTYVVGGASWSPAYEARALEHGAEGEGQGSVELALFGTVSQRTGEPWEAAQLILSTALPRSDATPPELAQLHVYADKREPPKKVLVRRDEYREHAESAGELEQQVAGVEPQGLSTQFPVSALADVAGDGTPARLELARVSLPATFAWRVFPSQLPYVFRAADVTNTAPFALLAGPVDLFRKSGLMGRAQLARVASGAPFHLSFGLEERLHVKRLVVEELAKDTGFFSKGKRFRFRYAFELQSLLPEAATLEVADRVPVSELDDVQVGIDEQTTAGFELRKDDGIVRWKTSLAPSEKKRLELAFHIDVPSSYDSGGM